jgi:hypothetical protein
MSIYWHKKDKRVKCLWMPLRLIRGVEVKHHSFLTVALDGGEWSISHPGGFTPRESAPCYSLNRRPDERHS